MVDQKQEPKKEEKPCEHKHPSGDSAWQYMGTENSNVVTENGVVPVAIIKYICPYCNGIKPVILG